MDEINLVRSVAPPAPGLPPGVRDAARATLLAEIATEHEARTAPRRAAVPGRRTGAPGSPRRVRWGIAGAVLAAAVVAAVTLPSALAGAPSSPTGRPRPAITATAVLLRAARATAALPDLHPRPDQYVYTESVSQYRTGPRTITRAWLSADGWHGGLTLMQYPPGKRWFHGARMRDCLTVPHSNWYYRANCPNPPAYVTTLPRTVTAMKRSLLGPAWPRKPGAGRGAPPAASAIMGIVSADYQFLVPHRASALMFQALSQIKGMKVIDHATTLAGRTGIAVAAYDPTRGTLDELIFDPTTYLYIGDLEIAQNSTSMPKGTVNGNAVLQIAVTDKPGQLPPGNQSPAGSS